MNSPVRMLVVWCPDWPVVAAAAGRSPRIPAAVIAANRVVACSATARADGVRRGMRRREAQGCCPELVVYPDDPARDARAFEPVAAAVEELSVGVEVIRPGVVAVPAKGPVGFFGGAQAAAERLVDQVAQVVGVECQVGIADGLFAATLAARRGLLIPPGEAPRFLAPLPVGELNRPADGAEGDRAELVDLLRRMGLRTLGAFAAVAERDVASRFGAGAVRAHRLARGLQERPAGRRRPPPELAVSEVLDPPVDRVDAAAFVARTLATRLHARLAAHGLASTRLGITAGTEHGVELHRVWRCAEPLTPAGIADRVRWQLDGWLRNPVNRPAGPVCLLRLEPEEVVDGQALQLDLWRGAGHAEAAERAGRAMLHVQGLLGQHGVLVPALRGGRGPAEQVCLLPWGDELPAPAGAEAAPWPGRLPVPSPTVLPDPVPATVLDHAGEPVEVLDRYQLTARPAAVTLPGGGPRPVLGWAGPWPVDERWWEPDSPAARRVSRVQVLLGPEPSEMDEAADETTALLLACVGPRWTVEGSYD